MPSIKQNINALANKNDAKALRSVLDSVLADLVAIRASQAQFIVDYNANAQIATDTTATAPVLKTTA